MARNPEPPRRWHCRVPRALHHFFRSEEVQAPSRRLPEQWQLEARQGLAFQRWSLPEQPQSEAPNRSLYDGKISKRFLLNDALTFLDHDHAIGRNMRQRFLCAAKPPDLHPRLLCRSQAEVQSEVVLRAKASAAANLLHLPPIVRKDNHTRPYSCAVGCSSDQLYQQPGVRRGRLIAQQRRIIVQVVDHDTGAPRIENVSESRTPSAARFKESRTRLAGNIGKATTIN